MQNEWRKSADIKYIEIIDDVHVVSKVKEQNKSQQKGSNRMIHWSIIPTAHGGFLYKLRIAYTGNFLEVGRAEEAMHFRDWDPCYFHIVLLNSSYAKIHQIDIKPNK